MANPFCLPVEIITQIVTEHSGRQFDIFLTTLYRWHWQISQGIYDKNLVNTLMTT